MQTDKTNKRNDDQSKPLQEPGGKITDPNVQAAHREAEKDIENDPDLSIHHPNDDLDEGETARLGEGKNDLI